MEEKNHQLLDCNQYLKQEGSAVKIQGEALNKHVLILNNQLLDRIQALEEEGLVDSHLRLCHSLKEDSGQFFFVNLVPIFFTDVRTVVKEMATILNQAAVDFQDLYEYCIKLEGSAACIGALRMRKSCSNLRQAAEMRSKDGCLRALDDIKCEYDTLQTELGTVLQLERDIISSETNNYGKSPACAFQATSTKFKVSGSGKF